MIHLKRKHSPWLLACLATLGCQTAYPLTRELPASGLIIQLRPDASEANGAVRTLRDQPMAARERAQTQWHQRHTTQSARLARVAAQAGMTASRMGSAGSAWRLDFDPSLSMDQQQAAINRLLQHPDVLGVTRNVRWQRTQAAPNDALFSQQWHLQAPSVWASALNMPAAWSLQTGATAPVVVAVLDGGVRYDHPDLAGHLLAGYDFVSEVGFANDGNGRDADASDPGDWVSRAESLNSPFRESLCEATNSSWHGTAIAGQIAAASNNGLGVAGTHWGAQVLPVRIAGKCGAELSDLLDGMRWAAGLPVAGVPLNTTPARIINLSYGGSGPCDGAYQQAVDDVTAAGVLMVVAAGNASEPLTRPADCSGVVAVSAVRGDGAKAAYSSYGTGVALSVPGGSGVSGAADSGLLTTSNSGRTTPIAANYESLSGTSFAAPLVAGTAALMLSEQPLLAPADLAKLLKQGVRPHTAQANLATCQAQAVTQAVCNCTTSTCGAGLLDAGAAVAAARAATATPIPTTPLEPVPATSPATTTPADEGGGGSTSLAWGLALWAWLAALAASRFKARKSLPKVEAN